MLFRVDMLRTFALAEDVANENDQSYHTLLHRELFRQELDLCIAPQRLASTNRYIMITFPMIRIDPYQAEGIP